MPRLYCKVSSRIVAYCLDGGGSGYQELPFGYTPMETEYIAIMYGLTEYFNKWNKELDARYSDLDPETKEFYNAVGSPADRTARLLPPAVLVCLDSEIVVKQISQQYPIAGEKLYKLAQRIWQMTKNVEVKYQWTGRTVK